MKALMFSLSLSVIFVVSDHETRPDLATALEGAWEIETVNGSALEHRGVLLLQSPYAFYTEFDVENKKFIGSQGGAIEITGNKMSFTTEFNTCFVKR